LDSRPNVFAVLSTVVFMFIITACQSTTEKTVDQTLSDASISTAVQAKLTSDRVSQFLHVNVTTERGIVTLSGMVATKAQRGQAERLARQVKGVLKVKNILQIKNHPTAAGKPVPPNHLPDTKGPPPARGADHSRESRTSGWGELYCEERRWAGSTVPSRHDDPAPRNHSIRRSDRSRRRR